jgi:hypothetical protein
MHIVGPRSHKACHRLGMQTNCQCQVAAVTAPSSGVASPTICVSFMTSIFAMALVAIPLLSLLVTGHGILVIGMSITPVTIRSQCCVNS